MGGGGGAAGGRGAREPLLGAAAGAAGGGGWAWGDPWGALVGSAAAGRGGGAGAGAGGGRAREHGAWERRRRLESEGLDYAPQRNAVQRRLKGRPPRRRLWGYTGTTAAKYLITALTGLVTGVLAFAVARGGALLLAQRAAWADSVDWSPGAPGGGAPGPLGPHALVFLRLTGSGLSLLLLAAGAVQLVAPRAEGAGVSLVMAYLNGNHVPDLLRFRVLATKVFGTIATVGSGLPLGPEGPMVHIGAAVASNITYNRCKGQVLGCLGDCDTPGLSRGRRASSPAPAPGGARGGGGARPPRARSPVRRRGAWLRGLCRQWILHDDADHVEFISAGAAAGLAAAFGAPIGGVMFAWEEAATHWSRKLTWRCFMACALSTLVLMVCHNDATVGILNLSSGSPTRSVGEWHSVDFLVQLPFFIATALVGGLQGALFNTLRGRLVPLRAPKRHHALRLAEVALVGLACLALMYALALSPLSQCVPRPRDADGELLWAPSYGLRLACPEGEVNTLFTLFFDAPETSIENFFSLTTECTRGAGLGAPEVPCGYGLGALAAFSATTLLVTALASGVAIPGGLFMPSILIGGSSGALLGAVFHLFVFHPLGLVDRKKPPGIYALVGATACLGGVFRSSISLVVIVLEGTKQVSFLFEIILAVVVSNWVAHVLHSEGVYESDLERDGTVAYLRAEPPNKLKYLTAGDIMSPDVMGFQEIASVQQVLRVIRDSTHNGFPVFCSEEPGLPGGRLSGTVLRTQLIVLLRRHVFCSASGRPLGLVRHTSDEDEGRGGGGIGGEDGGAGAEELLEEAIEYEMRTFHQRQGIWNRHTWASEDRGEMEALETGIIIGIREILAAEGPPLLRTLSPKLPHRSPQRDGDDGGCGGGGLEGGCRSPLAGDADGEGGAGTPAGPDATELFTQAFMRLHVDLRPYMRVGPLSVREDCCGDRAYQLFTSCGLRHLCVTDSSNRVRGLITRKDLDAASGSGWWRHTAPSAHPSVLLPE